MDPILNMKKTPYLGDPRLFEPTRVVVLKPFYVNGKPAKVGETVEVTLELARDLVHRERARYEDPKKAKVGWV